LPQLRPPNIHFVSVLRFVDAQEYAELRLSMAEHNRTSWTRMTTGGAPTSSRRRVSPGDFAASWSRRRCEWSLRGNHYTLGAHVVGIDLSRAVEAAAPNLVDRDPPLFKLTFFKLPFRLRAST